MDIKPDRLSVDKIEFSREEVETERLAADIKDRLGTAYEPVIHATRREGALIVEDLREQRVVRAYRLLRDQAPPEQKARYAEVQAFIREWTDEDSERERRDDAVRKATVKWCPSPAHSDSSYKRGPVRARVVDGRTVLVCGSDEDGRVHGWFAETGELYQFPPERVSTSGRGATAHREGQGDDDRGDDDGRLSDSDDDVYDYDTDVVDGE